MNLNNVLKILLLILAVTMLTGCSLGREKLTYDGKEGKIVFAVKKSDNCKLSTNKKDFRTTREQAAILGKDYKIGIKFDEDFGYFFKGDVKELKKAKKKYDNYKEVKYSGIKGIQYFYIGYMRYEIILPIDNNKETYLVLSINGKEDNKKSAKEAIESKEVQDILNHIKEVKIKKSK